MPGIPKSCAICQTRKVKCDRITEGCSQCIKYGWTCPGYPKPGRKRVKSMPSKRVSRGKYTRNVNPDVHPATCDQMHTNPGSQQTPVDSLLALQIPLPSIAESTVALELVWHLSSKSTSPGASLQQLGCFVELVPARIGLSKALDDAVRCLCAGYSAFMSPHIVLNPVYYSKALNSLHTSLYDTREALSAEILCASICLSWYELLTNNSDSAWLTYTTGIKTLIELRGPLQHSDEFGRALLHAQHAYITCNALMDTESSFLCNPTWMLVIDRPLQTNQSVNRLLIDHFQKFDVLSLIRKDFGAIAHAQGDVHLQITEAIGKAIELERATKRDLYAMLDDTIDNELPMGTTSNPHAAILVCKHALLLVLLNVEVHDLWHEIANLSTNSSSLAALSREIGLYCGIALDLRQDHNHKTGDHDAERLGKHLLAEIDHFYRVAYLNYQQAVITSTLNSKRMVSAYRNMHKQLVKKRNPHPIWESIIAMMENEF